MTEPDKNFRVKEQEGNRDHPEQYPTDSKSLFDMWESEKNVDPIPMEDLNMEKQEEKKRRGESKNRSSSAEKYKSGFER